MESLSSEKLRGMTRKWRIKGRRGERLVNLRG
jgi:hypothetical protein